MSAKLCAVLGQISLMDSRECSRAVTAFHYGFDVVLAILGRGLQIVKLLAQAVDVGLELLHLRLQFVLHVGDGDCHEPETKCTCQPRSSCF